MVLGLLGEANDQSMLQEYIKVKRKGHISIITCLLLYNLDARAPETT
jgi:hypothetical protein